VKKGTNATLTATLKDSGGSGIGGNTVKFYVDGSYKGPVTTDTGIFGWGAGVAKLTISTSSYSVGDHSVMVTFAGDSSYVPSESTDSDGLVVKGFDLTVYSNISGASVYLDGSYKGTTSGLWAPYSCTISNVYGSHTVKVSKSGWETKQQSVSVYSDTSTTVNLRRNTSITITPKTVIKTVDVELEAILKDSGGSGIGGKTVKFYVDGSYKGPETTDTGILGWGAGVAKLTISTPSLSVGDHSVKVTFAGDSDYAPSDRTDTDGLKILTNKKYIGTDMSHSDVPDYAQWDYDVQGINPGGICLATAGAGILGYWDRIAYQSKTYWNLIDNGKAPLEDLSTSRNPGGTNHNYDPPEPGPNVEQVVHWIGHEYYDKWWSGIWNEFAAAAIRIICNDALYHNNLWFTVEAVGFIIVPAYSDAQAEIDEGRPFIWLVNEASYWSGFSAGKHALPSWGYQQTGNQKWIRVHKNGGYFGEMAFGPWEENPPGTSGFIRIIPGGDAGDPADHYESDNSSSQATLIEPADLHNYLQTHNFYISSDVDWMRFSAVSGKTYTIKTENLGLQASTRLYIYKASDLSQAVDSDTDGGTASVTFDCLTSPKTSEFSQASTRWSR